MGPQSLATHFGMSQSGIRHRLKKAGAYSPRAAGWGWLNRPDYRGGFSMTHHAEYQRMKLEDWREEGREHCLRERDRFRLSIELIPFDELDRLPSTSMERLTWEHNGIRSVRAPKDSTTEPMAAQRRYTVRRSLETLTFREREIVKLRFGIGDGWRYTLEQIGRIFKIQRERVRQVEAKALRKLQTQPRRRPLERLLKSDPDEA